MQHNIPDKDLYTAQYVGQKALHSTIYRKKCFTQHNMPDKKLYTVQYIGQKALHSKIYRTKSFTQHNISDKKLYTTQYAGQKALHGTYFTRNTLLTQVLRLPRCVGDSRDTRANAKNKLVCGATVPRSLFHCLSLLSSLRYNENKTHTISKV
jgi:hypothetical protein